MVPAACHTFLLVMTNLLGFVFQLDGSLIILAENVLGSPRIDENGETVLHYGKR